MDFGILITFIRVITQAITWVVIVAAIISFFLPPYHPVREALDRIVNPFLEPIRRIVPMVGTLDFSPLILIVAINFLSQVLIFILS